MMTVPTDTLSAALGRPLTEGQRASLRAYAALLAAENARVNLTAVRSPAEIERRHLLESLALARLLEAHGALLEGGDLVDVGSGGGLPGIPLAIVRPGLRVTLLEATGKKAAFLEAAARDLRLTNIAVLTARAEEAGRDPAFRERFDLATARAVAPLAVLAELALPLVRPGGLLAAVKGSRVHEEVAAGRPAVARCGGRIDAVEPLPLTGAPALAVVLVAKVSPTPADLPRRPGIPAKRPLR